MLIRLSSKGRLVIPKTLREKLRLQNKTLFRVRVKDGEIILEPLSKEIVYRLHGKYAGHNLLNALENEHRQEK
jgi:AbrB family looped-hinge helix DNA binding protein